MVLLTLVSLLSLPPAAIALLLASPSAAEAEPQWPHNLPRHLKYFPEDEAEAKRALGIRERLQHERPVGVKKMSLDEGEMFMLDSWIFASTLPRQSPQQQPDYPYTGALANATLRLRSPLRPVAQDDYWARLHVRNGLWKRQFACPEGTRSCSDIGAPDVCCGSASSCINVRGNADAGSVGCCPQGQTCAGPVSCDASHGYSACPGSSNGGCCLPGFRCQGIGCVAEGTSTTYVSPPKTSLSTTAAQPSSTATTSTPPPAIPAPSSSSYVCSTGWFSCAASLGGGCCQNGRTCATGASCIGSEPTSTQAPSAPVRPTSGSALTTQSAAPPDNICPSGFYVCSAYLPSGCCRVGRDCQTTGSCVLPTETILSTNGVVVVAPTGASAAATGAAQPGSCPSAWYSCAANRGGNCCPNGFECGEQCTVTAAGQSGVQGKVAPSAAASFVPRVWAWLGVAASAAVGAAMLAL